MTSDELRKLATDCLKKWQRMHPGVRRGGEQWAVDMVCDLADSELDRLTKRVAELEAPQDKWPVVDKRDGHVIGACPLCGCEYSIGEYGEGGK